MKLGLIPVKNFGIIKEGELYRSAQPIYNHEYQWLKEKLDIQTIVNLRWERHHDNIFGPKWGMKVENIEVVDHNPPKEEHVAKFIEILDNRTGPLLFHCEHGHGRTSTFNVIARIHEGWTLEEALKEEEEEFGYNFFHPKQIKFLSNLETIVNKYKNVSHNTSSS